MGNILSFDIIFRVIDSGEMIRSWNHYNGQQVTLDFSLEPYFGEVSLRTNFSPNLYQIELVAGGNNSVSAMGNDCVGFAATRPDFRLNWSGISDELYVLFLANEDYDDATLIINTPEGKWVCNDDAYDGTLNPGIIIDSPVSGQYDIWVGSYRKGEYIEGILYITENFEDSDESDQTIDWRLTPYFGSQNLSSGLLPDPFTIAISAGGSRNLGRAQLGSECIGYVEKAPDFRLHWSGEADRLIFTFIANHVSDDATLIINAPNGSWHCNDDAHTNTLNPQIIFFKPTEGQYDIWIGTYHLDDLIRGQLNISEFDDYVP